MSYYSKDKSGVDKYDYTNICKSHSARTDRELYRICPSKLSKRELEDLYFALLENNLDLKRTINGQQDRIRGLSTKVQRLNASQKFIQSKELKDCCVGTKALVSDQKEYISDLKHTNQRMAERIRMLNLRLSSAKQFQKKSPWASVSRCLQCAHTSAPPQNAFSKPSSSSKPSEQTNQTLKLSGSPQNEDRDAISARSVQTEPCEVQGQHSDLPCDENKCRTIMDELKQKIVDLQDELSQTHEEYSSRINRLESEVSEVRRENIRVRGEHSASQHELGDSTKRTAELLESLRAAEAKCAELSMQLSIEKRKVAELETRLKAANMSDRVNETIKNHFAYKNSGQKNTCTCVQDFDSIITTPTKTSAQDSQKTEKGSPSKITAMEVEKTTDEVSQRVAEIEDKPKAAQKPETYLQVSRELTDTGLSSKLAQESEMNTQVSRPQTDTELPPKPIEQKPEMLSQVSEKLSDTATSQKQPQDVEKIFSQTSQKTSESDLAAKGAQEAKISNPQAPEKAALNGSPSQKQTQEVEINAQPSRKLTDTILTIKEPRESEALAQISQIDGGLVVAQPTQEVKGSNCVCLCPPRDQLGTDTKKGLDCVCACHPQQDVKLNSASTKALGCTCACPTMQDLEVKGSITPKASDFKCACPPKQNALATIKTKAQKKAYGDAKEKKVLDDSGNSDTSSSPKTRDEKTRGSDCVCLCPPREDYKATDTKKGPDCVCACHPQQDAKLNSASTKELGCTCACLMIQDFEAKNSITPRASNFKCACPPQQNAPAPVESVNKTDQAQKSPNEDVKVKKVLNDSGYMDTANRSPKGQDERTRTNAQTYPTVPVTGSPTKVTYEDEKTNKLSEDSGYTDTNKSQDIQDERGLNKMNEELMKRIIELQNQVDSMKDAWAKQLPGNQQGMLNETAETKTIDDKSKIKAGDQKCATTSDQDISYTKATAESGSPCEYKAGVRSCRKKSEVHTGTPLTLSSTRMQILEDCDSIKLSSQADNPSKCELLYGLRNEKAADSKRMTNAMQTTDDRTDQRNFFKTVDYTTDIKAVSDRTDLYLEEDRPQKSDMLTGGLKLPMTDGVKCSNRENEEVAYKKDPFVGKETCSRCEVCTYEKECESRHFSNEGKTEGIDARPEPTVMREHLKNVVVERPALTVKNDQHNSLQIPGPIPVAETTNKDWKKNIFRRFSIDAKKKDSQKNKDKNEKHKKENDTENGSDKTQKRFGGTVVNPMIGAETTNYSDRLTSLEKEEEKKALRAARRESKALSRDNLAKLPSSSSHVPLQESLNNCYRRSDQNILPLNFPAVGAEQSTRINKNDQMGQAQTFQELNLEEQSRATQVDGQDYKLPPPHQRRRPSMSDQETYTIDSSKQTRATSPDNTECEISSMTDLSSERDARSPNKTRQLSPGEDKMTTTYTDSYTSPVTNFSLSEGELPATNRRRLYQVNRRELEQPPIENDDTPPTQKMEEALQAISDELARCKNLMMSQRPTEVKSVANGTEASKSEVNKSPVSSVALALLYGNTKNVLPQQPLHQTFQQKPQRSIQLPHQQPRQSLQITLAQQEIRRPSIRLPSQHPPQMMMQHSRQPSLMFEQQPRRKSLLQHSQQTLQEQLQQLQDRGQQHAIRNMAMDTPEQSKQDHPIALRRGIATQSIGDMYAPKCIFTLHIGTVVLSDEAILNSRNKALVLTWKFYDQNVAMTRVHPGRVVLFDFSTEYDIKLTENFLNYMKHEEMPIVICELDEQDQPFAICALPLRDALLHTNRRADMSLALIAGPQMLSARAENGAAADALDSGDEVGVIDLWCMLRADSDLLPHINHGVMRPMPRVVKPSQNSLNSRIMHQVHHEPSKEYCDRYIPGKRPGLPINEEEQQGKREYVPSARPWGSSVSKLPCTFEIDGVTQTASPPKSSAATRAEDLYDDNDVMPILQPSRYPPVRRKRSQHDSDEEPERDSSRIIPNEVEAKIKSPGDLRQALVHKAQQSDNSNMQFSDEHERASRAHSSLGSLRNIVAKLKGKSNERHSGHSRTSDMQRQPSFVQLMEKFSRTSVDFLAKSPSVTKPSDTREQPDSDIYKKYDNIGKFAGSNRAESSKKSVTIVPKYVESNTEAPQKDVARDSNPDIHYPKQQSLEITIQWLALNEECEAMVDPHVQRVYVAYSFLGRHGAELETPVSMPKPKNYIDKCYFNFKKKFELEDSDLPLLGHMARCRSFGHEISEDAKDCIVFTVVSEPPEDPLGLESCEDIGYACLYLGDLLAYSGGSSSYSEVVPVRAARGVAAVCGVLAVRLDGLDVVRRCLLLSDSQRNSSIIH